MRNNFHARGANDIAHRTTIGDMAKDLWGTTGGRIKWARMRAEMTQAALGRAVGVKNVYISQLENNVHEASRARTWWRQFVRVWCDDDQILEVRLG